MSKPLAEWIAHVSVVCAINYSTIAVTTSLVVLVMAAVLLVVRKEALSEEHWVLYLGLAFGAFFFQYGLRAVAAWMRAGNYAKVIPRLLELVAQLLFSNLNSVFFLLAALALLYILPKEWWRQTKWKARIVVVLIVAALGTFLRHPWDRYFDATLSAFCLSILSWAMYVSSGTRQQHGWARLNLLGGVGYVALHGVYAAVPTLAQSPRLAKALAIELARFGHNPAILPTAEDALDAGVFAFAFGFKVTLFVGALLVIMRCLSTFSPSVSRAVLDSVKTARGEFLAASGIVSAMAQSIGADKAALYLRLPGTERNELLALKWADGAGKPAEPLPCPSKSESTLGLTMEWSEILWSRDRRKDTRFTYSSDSELMRSFVNVPLLYHGAVIGCLTFDWRKANAFTATDVQRVRQIADFVSPVVQTERWLRGIADLRQRLQHYSFTPEQLETATFMSRLGHELHDVLAPYATFVRIDFGFHPIWSMQHALALRSSDDSRERRSLQELEEHFRYEVHRLETAPIFEPTSLNLAAEPIGGILLAVQRGHDPLHRPSLTQEKGQLESIAVLVKDVVFDLQRKHLSGIVHQLHATLDARGFASEVHWMRTVREAISEAGLREVGVTPGNTRIHRNAPPDTIISIDGLREIRSPSESIPYRIFAWHPTGGSPQSVIEVPLKTSEETIFVAVARPDFGRELDVDLPWRLFVDRLAVAADSSLARIRAIELESDALQFEMNDLLVHELKNHAEKFRMGVEEIKESLKSPNFRPDDTQIKVTVEDMNTTSSQFLELAGALKSTAVDTRSEVPLADVQQRVDRFYMERLAARSIHLQWTIQSDLVIGVPIHPAYLAVVSLVQNSRDAIGNAAGLIQLQSQQQGPSILLHVDDNGNGVPEEIRGRIFDLGFTTKRNGSGHGLALVRRALNRYGGDLTLTQPPPGMSTRFTIRFPKEQ
jgi:signal transduction histidine kinase